MLSLSAAVPDSIFKAEADSFLMSMPAGLQSAQAAALECAIGGDSGPFARIRASRDVCPELPSGVDTVAVAAGMRLYPPAGTAGSSGMPLLVYFHGGGWAMGSINSCARFCAALASEGRMAVLAVDYPLAPEFPFPAAVDYCDDAVVYAYRHAVEWGCDPAALSVGGDSSGGNLAIVTAMNASVPLDGLLLFYPVTYAAADGSGSWRDYASGAGLDGRLMETFNRAYLRRTDAEDPRVSPLSASDDALRSLPRTLLVAAGRDILCRQGCRFADRLSRAGVEVCRIEFSGSVHLFITVPGQPSAFAEAVRLSAAFLSR